MGIRLYIIGDVRLHRDGLALQLEGAPTIEIVGSGTPAEALDALRTSSADVALLDSVPSPDSAPVIERLRAARRRLRIVAIGIREVESEVLACAAAGIDGYVRMDAGSRGLVTAIESVMRGELVCSPKVAASLYHSVASLGSNGLVALTDRELQVVELMNRGLSNKEISLSLNIETCTAKNHVQNIMQKLGVHRRGQAVAMVRHTIGRHFG